MRRAFQNIQTIPLFQGLPLYITSHMLPKKEEEVTIIRREAKDGQENCMLYYPQASLSFSVSTNLTSKLTSKTSNGALRVCWKGPAKTLLTGRFLGGPLTWLTPRHRRRLRMASIRSSQWEGVAVCYVPSYKGSTYTLGGDARRAGGSYGQHKKTASIR